MSLRESGRADIPAQTGRLVVVTGASGGLGFATALALAQGCADVIVGARNESRGREAAARIRAQAPDALVRFEKLDVADLASVSAFARRLRGIGRPLDLLVNNAGVMALPERQLSVDGFEMQLATNYLGHFALTSSLLPLLRLSRSPRVVQVSSLAHRLGKIRFDDLHGERRYGPWSAYFQSKLATLMFARQLQRQSDARKWGLRSSAAHPGYAQTNLVSNGLGPRSLVARLSRTLGRLVSQSAAQGAQPVVFAAASEIVEPGGFYGPGGMMELSGAPAAAYVSARARDEQTARQLWEVSQELTGAQWTED
jgi:NAD(P)-dependent dehydrogenase (short-subunit alcohol dehydrogenase family)